MTDRVIRDELLDSDRWLDLPSDTDRLVYAPGLLLRCDDFGNIEGHLKRLFRFMRHFAQVKTEENAAAVLGHLTDADLIRGYKVANREFFHLPRFRPHRQYLVRKCPPSPWDSERPLGKEKRVLERGLALDHALTEKVVATSLPSAYHVAEGVGVGVDKIRTSAETPVDNFVHPKPAVSWAQFWKAQGEALGINPLPGESEGDYCRRVQRISKGD